VFGAARALARVGKIKILAGAKQKYKMNLCVVLGFA
jgi:hypothetical protein